MDKIFNALFAILAILPQGNIISTIVDLLHDLQDRIADLQRDRDGILGSFTALEKDYDILKETYEELSNKYSCLESKNWDLENAVKRNSQSLSYDEEKLAQVREVFKNDSLLVRVVDSVVCSGCGDYKLDTKIHCIKLVRILTNMGLKEAKDWVEAHWSF